MIAAGENYGNCVTFLEFLTDKIVVVRIKAFKYYWQDEESLHHLYYLKIQNNYFLRRKKSPRKWHEMIPITQLRGKYWEINHDQSRLLREGVLFKANINPQMDMQKIVTLDGFGVRADPREHFVKNATLN